MARGRNGGRSDRAKLTSKAGTPQGPRLTRFFDAEKGARIMPVKSDIDAALKDAMRAKDGAALDALRAVKSAVKLAEIEAGKEFVDAEVHALIQKAIKQRRDSIEQFTTGGRPDLVAKEQAQVKVLEKFLPAQLSEPEIAALVAEAVAATGAAGSKDMGKVMAALMPKVKGRADGGLVNRLVKAKLG